MTCIVGLKHDGKVYIGGDAQGSSTYNKTIRVDEKIFIKDEMIFGFTTSYRMGQILRYSFDVPERSNKILDDMKYLVGVFIPALITCYSNQNYLQKHKESAVGGTFLMGYRSRLFKVDTDFQVAESSDDYDSCGCGQDFALGSMFSTDFSKLSPEKRVATAINSANKFSTYCGGDPYILNI